MILERYAFYSKGVDTPAGSFEHCFFVGDTADPPVVDGVTIPRKFYEVRQEIEINFSHCTVPQLQGILCKFPNFYFGNRSASVSHFIEIGQQFHF